MVGRGNVPFVSIFESFDMRISSSHLQHGFPWLSFAYHSYHLLLLHSLSTKNCYWSATTDRPMCRNPSENIIYGFILVSWAVLCMSCSSYLDGFWDWRYVAIQLGIIPFRICSKQLVTFWCDSHPAFSPCLSLTFRWCIHAVVMTLLQLGRKPILLKRSDFHMIDNLSLTVYMFARHILTSLLVNEILLLRYVNWSTDFRDLLLKVEMDL